MVGEYFMFFQNNTHSNQLYFNISQKFSDTAVILAIAVSKRCTQDLPVVTIRKARVLDFCLPTIRPFQKIVFKEYFFSGIVDFGVPFQLTSSLLRHFQASEKLWNKTPCPLQLVAFVDWKNSKHVWDLISLKWKWALYPDETLPLVH